MTGVPKEEPRKPSNNDLLEDIVVGKGIKEERKWKRKDLKTRVVLVDGGLIG